MKALAPAIGLIQTCVFLGGTIVVFGKLTFVIIPGIFKTLFTIYFCFYKGWYNQWTYDVQQKDNEGYCAYPAFIFAFVLLIIEWILMPLFICGICCIICGSAIMGRSDLDH